MMKALSAIVAAVFALVPSIAQPQTDPSTIGVGPHGYDWEAGSTYSCTNSMPPTPFSGPANTTESVTRSDTGAILYHTTGTNFEVYDYSVYVPSKKMWTGPIIVADGSYGNETTADTGKKIVWTGSLVDSAGATTQIRDTIVYDGTSYTDLGESQVGGIWKAQYKTTCTKS
jgi:hypothetical protein